VEKKREAERKEKGFNETKQAIINRIK